MEDALTASEVAIPMSPPALGLSGSLNRARRVGGVAVLKKALVRIVRDARIRWKHLRAGHKALFAAAWLLASALLTAAALLLILGPAARFAAARALRINKPGHLGIAPFSTKCRCPFGDPKRTPDAPVDPASLGKNGRAFENLLVSAAVVGRARMDGSGVDPHHNSNPAHVRFKWDMLLRGNPRIAERSFVVDTNEALGCHANHDFPDVQPDGYYLILSGFPSSIGTSNDTILARPLHCGSVVLLLWNSIAKPYRTMLLQEHGDDQNWWGHAKRVFTDDSHSSEELKPIKPGLSVFAACRDRDDLLLRTLPSWLAIPEVDEVIIVDWGSSTSLLSQLHQHLPHLLADPRLYVARVQNQDSWILSRAYNLAAALTTRERIFKADVDTLLQPSFFDTNPLEDGMFYAGDWRANTDESQLHTNGLLYCFRRMFFAVNGFDERIVTYGWDDNDIVKRMESPTTNHKPFNLAHVVHLNHSHELRVGQQQGVRGSLIAPSNPFAPAVEIQRNRILATKMDVAPWGLSSRQTKYNLFWRQMPGLPLTERTFIPSSSQPCLTELVSEHQALDASKRAIRIVLRDRFGLTSFSTTWHLDFYIGLLDRLAFPARYGHVTVNLLGGCGSRILGYAAAQAAAHHATVNHKPWHMQVIWKESSPSCACQFENIFVPTDAVVTEHAAPIATTEGFSRESVDTLSAVEIEANSSILVSVKCGLVLTNETNRDQIRRELAKMIPSVSVQESIGRNVRGVFQLQPGGADDPTELSKFSASWRGKISHSRFNGWSRDLATIRASERPLHRTRITALDGCARNDDEADKLLADYPELLTILTGILSSSTRFVT